jgi:hypothetical protein
MQFDYLMSLFERLAETSSFLSAAAAIAGIIFSLAANWAKSRVVPEKDDARLDQLAIQISHIKNYREKQLFQASVNRISSYLLNISQYVVGAALVTSSISDALPKDLLGVLGVITLLSSFAHQQLRPDIKRAAAARRVIELTELLRAAEITAAGIPDKNDAAALHAAREYMISLHKIQRDDLLAQRPA